MTQSYPAYQLTCADIDRLKVISARIFDRRVSPQSRLEIIARSSGFNTFAAMTAALKEGPVRLRGDQFAEEYHIEKAGIDLAHVPFVSGVSLNEIIAAGLAWSERSDPEWAATKSKRERLKQLKRDGGTLHKYLDFLTGDADRFSPKERVYRSSLTWSDIREIQADSTMKAVCKDTSVIMTSPENAVDLTYDFETEEPACVRPGEWRCARVPLSKRDRFFEPPLPEQVPWEDREKLEALIDYATIVVFDEDDLARVKKGLKKAGIGPLKDYRFKVIRPDALDMEGETDWGFFLTGYYGTARNERPSTLISQSPSALSDAAFAWMCEIYNVVHGCAYEFARMSLGSNAPYEDDTQDQEWSRLVVEV